MDKKLTFKLGQRKLDYILKDEMTGRRKIYVYETSIPISLEIKRLLLMQGFYPVSFSSIDELINTSIKEPPYIFFLCINNKEELEYIEKIKNNSHLKDIFVIASSMLKGGDTLAYDHKADIYFAKPLTWKVLPFIVLTVIFIYELRSASVEDDNISVEAIELKFNTSKDTIMEITF